MHKHAHPKDHPLISVLIPVYNAETTLPRCMSSVLAQTCTNLEVVLVNDGSTDGSAPLCDRFAAEDTRVRVVHQQNKGSAAARNEALRHAKGAYISWVDADDFIWPTFLEHLYSLARTFGTRMSMCRFEDTTQTSLPSAPKAAAEPDCLMDFETYARALHSVRETEMIVLWNKLYDAALWQGVCFPGGGQIDDAHVVWKLVYAAGGIAVSTLPLYFYYQTPHSIMRGNGAALRQLGGLESLYARYKFLEMNDHHELAGMALRRYYENIIGIARGLPAGKMDTAVRKTLKKAYRFALPAVLRNRYFGKRLKANMLAATLAPKAYLPAVQGALAW